MSELSRHTRRIGATVIAVAAWVTASVIVGASTALARVGPDEPGYPTIPQTVPRTVTVETVDWTQLAVTALAACLIGVAATLALQLVVRHGRHTSAVHA